MVYNRSGMVVFRCKPCVFSEIVEMTAMFSWLLVHDARCAHTVETESALSRDGARDRWGVVGYYQSRDVNKVWPTGSDLNENQSLRVYQTGSFLIYFFIVITELVFIRNEFNNASLIESDCFHCTLLSWLRGNFITTVNWLILLLLIWLELCSECIFLFVRYIHTCFFVVCFTKEKKSCKHYHQN